MRLPDFLIIGAMKAGTTTLYHDLQRTPGVFLPSVKEPHTLCHSEVLTRSGRERYARFFRGARADQVCGEGSTGYTKLPWNPEVPDRALSLLGPSLRLIYILRHPIDRLASHYRHLVRAGRVTGHLDDVVWRRPELLNVSRYGMQLAPWVERFGGDRVRVLFFEEYVVDRRTAVAEVCRFLETAPPGEDADLKGVRNAGGSLRSPRPVLDGLLSPIRHSQVYKRSIHPRIPPPLNAGLKRLLFRRPGAAPTMAPKPETVMALWAELEEDLRRLADTIGRQPPWRPPRLERAT